MAFDTTKFSFCGALFKCILAWERGISKRYFLEWNCSSPCFHSCRYQNQNFSLVSHFCSCSTRFARSPMILLFYFHALTKHSNSFTFYKLIYKFEVASLRNLLLNFVLVIKALWVFLFMKGDWLPLMYFYVIGTIFHYRNVYSQDMWLYLAFLCLFLKIENKIESQDSTVLTFKNISCLWVSIRSMHEAGSKFL